MSDFKNFNEYFQEDENMKKLFEEKEPEAPAKDYEEKPEEQNDYLQPNGQSQAPKRKKHALYLRLYRLSAILFAGILVLFGFISCVDKDKTVSKEENRTLAQRPAFSLKALFSGDYTVDFENYYSDNFPARSFFIACNKKINSIFTQFSAGDKTGVVIKNDSNDDDFGGEGVPLVEKEVEPEPTTQPDNLDEKHDSVVDGAKDDEISIKNYLIVTKNSAMEIFSYNETIVQTYADLINKTAKAMPKGVKFYSLVAPTSAEFYGTEEYRSGSHSQYDAIKKIYEKLDDSIIKVDAYSPLNDHADQYIYFRTDHHWTARGAYYAYTGFCKKAGLEAPELSKFKTHNVENFVGSFYRTTQSEALKNNPDYVECFELLVEAENMVYSNASLTNGVKSYVVAPTTTSSNKYLVFIAGDQPIEKITTSVKNGKKILILKESYGNAFVPFLCNNYEEIYVIDPRQVKMNLPQFVYDRGVQEVIALNYCMGIGNKKYRTSLESLLGEITVEKTTASTSAADGN
ncbi:MAG: hypothetical protein IJU45_08170 [Clostridia bacterium]|nr:hypothetical protein [Clostridia bacterium]